MRRASTTPALVLAALLSSSAAARAQDAAPAQAPADAPREEPSPREDPPHRDVPPPLPEPGEPPLHADDASLPEGHAPTLSVRVTPDSGVMTGDVIHYELSVEVPEGDDVNLPRQSYAPLELVDQAHTESVAGGRRRFVFTLDLLALAPGEVTIPPIAIRVITADGVVGRASTEPRQLTVGSLVANEPNAEPRPPTDPVVVMQDDYTLAYVLGALGLVALGALLAWLFLRWWRRRPKELPPPPPPRPAHEVALEKLLALRRELPDALARGDQARVVDGASDALRMYLGQRFGFNGLESTTDEVILKMREHRLSGITNDELLALLGECDLVKFAKAIPDQAACERVIDGAEHIVRRSMFFGSAAAPPPPPAPAPTMKEPTLASPDELPRPSPLGAAAATDSSAAPAREAPAARDGARPIPVTMPPSAPSDEPIPATIPPKEPVAPTPREASFTIPETPAPRAEPPARIPETPTPPPPAEVAASAAPAPTIEEPKGIDAASEAIWNALDEAVAADSLVVGELTARREDGWLVALGEGVFGTLPEAHLGALLGAHGGAVGERHAFRVVALNVARRRVVLSHRDVDAAEERALLGRETPLGFADPSRRDR